jgi:N-formylmaleamate deformylase
MTNWSSGVYEAGGVELHYARALEDRVDVVMPDARGHGSSSAPLYGYRYDDHASEVIALIQRLELVDRSC